MKKISLSGVWKIQDRKKVSSEVVRFEFDEKDMENIGVPSHYQTHPKFQYYPEEVVYRRKFLLDKKEQGKTVLLRFEGVFYSCNVFLNEKYLGEHRGYFAPFEFDITDIVDFDDENLLVMAVSCPEEKVVYQKKMITGVFSRWDCKPPHIQPGGIWQEVNLAIGEEVYFKNCSLETLSLDNNSAKINLILQFTSKVEKNISLNYKIIPYNFEGESLRDGLSVAVNLGENTVKKEIEIKEPHLWWTYDVGFPHLYQIEVEMLDEEKILDTFTFTTGIRMVQMKNWHVYLNGKRVFLRGTNYAPADIRLSEATRELYENDLKLIKEANINSLRIHAHIEKKCFYEMLDEAGIFAWQDFPLQWYYVKEIKDEAISQIKEMVNILRHHPSIGIWCCHNEPFYIPGGDAVVGSPIEIIKTLFSFFGYNWNKDVLDKILEKVVKEEDKTRPVVRASGLIGYLWGKIGATDSHFYFGWYFGKMRHLDFFSKITFHSYSKFITEFGAQAFPNLENFSKIVPGKKIEEVNLSDLKSNYMLQPTLMEKKSTKKSEYLELSSYINATQEYQGKLNKYYIEYFRKLKYKPCGGIMHFMFADCYPGITWSIVDYFRHPKLSYFTVAKCFSPLYIMMDYPKEKYKIGKIFKANLYVVNDYHNDWGKINIEWNLKDIHGKIWKEEKNTVGIKKDSLEKIGKVWFKIPPTRGEMQVNLKLSSDDIKSIENFYNFEVK